MKRILFATLLASISTFSVAASIEGKWQTIDDETKKPKAIVSITQNGNVFNGKIVSLSAGVPAICNTCAYKKTLIGLDVVTGLKQDGKNTYSGGKIFDPKGGKTYQSKATLSADGKTLSVRGFAGISAFGRTQVWKRVAN